MDRIIEVATDHLSILNRHLQTSADVFFDLGFVRDGGKTELDRCVFEMTVPTSRFVFDNAYIECVQFPASVSEFYDLLNTPAGIHIAALLTPEAETLRKKLNERGVYIEELERVTRKNFDYGENKGTMIMQLVPIPYEIIPRTHVAFLEHMTRQLIYQPSRYQHRNGVTALESAVICCGDEEEADRIESELTRLCALAENQASEGGARQLRLMDPGAVYENFGIPFMAGGSAFSALTFSAPELDSLRGFLAGGKYPWRDNNDRIVVNLQNQIGMAFEFIRK